MGRIVTAATIIAELRARGVVLETDGVKLRWHPRAALSADELAELRVAKAAIIAELKRESAVTVTTLPTVTDEARGDWFAEMLAAFEAAGMLHPNGRIEATAKQPDLIQGTGFGMMIVNVAIFTESRADFHAHTILDCVFPSDRRAACAARADFSDLELAQTATEKEK